MATMISKLYGSKKYMVPFYWKKVDNLSKEYYIESKLTKDAEYLKKNLQITYEEAIHWLNGTADKFDRKTCEKAFENRLKEVNGEIKKSLQNIQLQYKLAV